MSEITNKILKKLKEGNIEKIPRWKFVMKRTLIWGSLVVAILLTAFSVSMIIFQFVAVEWDLLPRVGGGPFGGFFMIVPYFWLLVSGLLFTFVYFDFRNTKGGYRYSGGIVMAISLIISLLLGICFYVSTVSEFAEDLFARVPMYEHMHKAREMMWNIPDKGVLAGMVLEVNGNEALVLEDFGKVIWNVDISGAKIMKGMKVLVGMNIRVIGEINGPGKFDAEEIRLPKGRGVKF